jgi:Uma2 family endonuclease
MPVDASRNRFYRTAMATLTIELPPQRLQTEFNLRRWAEVLADRELARFEWRIETDRHGYVIMNPPPAPNHGVLQSEIAFLLRTLLSRGRVLTECPISTADGVRAADVAWASAESMRELGERVCFPRAPEIGVEVLSPGNTQAEIREKAALYFDAGAKEVWLCADSGAMTFLQSEPEPIQSSKICPEFPLHIRLSQM